MRKVFATGLQRTGTMSLTRAFGLLGLKARQFPFELLEDLHHPALARFDAFTDFPIPFLYRQLDRAYPGSRFVHTERDEDDWINSVRWLFTVGAAKFEWHLKPNVERVHREFYGTTTFSEPLFRERYRAHNAEVREYFSERPSDLLILRTGAGDEFVRLCPFLGLAEPAEPFPHVNTRESAAWVRLRRLWHRLRRALPHRSQA